MRRASKIILLNSKKEFLLFLRDNKLDIPFPGYWDFIGGETEKDETDLESIKREIDEEIENVNIGKIEFIGNILAGDNCNNSIFIGQVNTPLNKIKLNEGQRLNYFRFEELHKIKLAPYYMDFILKNKEKLGL
ncbi:acetyltransferase [Candidatus Pacearchaeota archaeon]|jgi:8-oxo-dGTP diphosphatase|nr:acetyltransferase [Candidatus Pacearchaeota archaeon]|tara:strand:+ start:30426 stop:30824 length:399 start_codon:yes stop_codon:yes gene_type:complete